MSSKKKAPVKASKTAKPAKVGSKAPVKAAKRGK